MGKNGVSGVRQSPSFYCSGHGQPRKEKRGSTGCPAAMRLPCYADFNAASTLSGVNGTERIRTPTAS